LYELRLREKGLLSEEQVEQLQEQVSQVVEDAIRQADADPNPALEARFDDVLAEKYPLSEP
jgi:TPP-dependent pyruvate/acetoin dehydrogenase alpha subunit